MIRMTLASKLKYYREKAGLTIYEVGEKIGKSGKTVSAWECGRGQPDADMLLTLCNVYGIKSISELYGLDEVAFEEKPTSRPIRIPVYGCIAAGIPLEEIEDIDDWEEINYPNARRGEYIALRIKGDSMEPRICEGDVIIIHLQPTVDNGDLAAVRVNDHYTDGVCATCKKVRFTPDGGIMLISTNPAYEPMYFSKKQIRDEGVEIIGKVVELRAKVG